MLLRGEVHDYGRQDQHSRAVVKRADEMEMGRLSHVWRTHRLTFGSFEEVDERGPADMDSPLRLPSEPVGARGDFRGFRALVQPLTISCMRPAGHSRSAVGPAKHWLLETRSYPAVTPVLSAGTKFRSEIPEGRWRQDCEGSCVDPPSSLKSSSDDPQATLASQSDLPLVTNLTSVLFHAASASWNATDVSLGTRNHKSFPASFKMSTGMADPTRPRNRVVALLRCCLTVTMSIGVGLLAMLKMER
jgi:hypothetical protein